MLVNIKKYFKLLSILSAVLVTILVFFAIQWPIGGHITGNHNLTALFSPDWHPMDFIFTDLNSDNITGFKSPIVPNIVHYVVLDILDMDFIHYLSVKSVLKNHRPDQVVIHCNCRELRGKYWHKLMSSAEDRQLIQMRHIDKPDVIFGRKMSYIQHKSDIARLQIMMTIGGIYLDTDVFVVKSLDPFRSFEFSIGWSLNEFLGTQVLVGHRNARFPRLWYESYRDYRSDLWYYNAGELPTKQILWPNPQLVHRVPHGFGVTTTLASMLYRQLYQFWEKDFYAIHLLAKHKGYMVPEDTVTTFDEQNIKTYNKTFGQMARLVLYGSKHLIIDKRP